MFRFAAIRFGRNFLLEREDRSNENITKTVEISPLCSSGYPPLPLFPPRTPQIPPGGTDFTGESSLGSKRTEAGTKARRPYNFLFLPMVDPTFGAHEKVLLVCPFSSDQQSWFDLECVTVYDGKKHNIVDCTKETIRHIMPSSLCHNLHGF
jgi:hypothetical protein